MQASTRTRNAGEVARAGSRTFATAEPPNTPPPRTASASTPTAIRPEPCGFPGAEHGEEICRSLEILALKAIAPRRDI